MEQLIDKGPAVIAFLLFWWIFIPTVAVGLFVGAWSWCESIE